MNLLQLENLRVGFRRPQGLLRQARVQMLGPLSLEIARGEVLALVGSSGAGKSLLAQAILDALPPNAVREGEVLFEGKPLDATSRQRLALLPQSASHLDPLAPCGRQLRWAGRRAGRPMNRRGAADRLQALGLETRAAQLFPHQVSGGMVRRVLLAMALAGNPDLLIADEPTSGLDEAQAEAVLGQLRAFAHGGRGVLLITHDLFKARRFAERVALLQEGRLVGVERAASFAGEGKDLASPFARALWQALPENCFFGHEDA